MRMLTTIAILLFTLTPQEYAAAEADRAQLPAADQPYAFYLTTSHLAGEHKAACEATTAFVVASSSRQPVIEKCTPIAVQDGLTRIHLGELKWDWRAWHRLLAAYPYSRAPGSGAIPLVVRADWLVVQLADATESDAYMLLLYGKEKITRDEYLASWGVNNKVESHFGLIARKQVGSPNVAEVRWIENRPTNSRGSSWGTRDSDKITKESDPLQHLDGGFKHLAEEWLTAMPKVSSATGEQGMLLAPFLSNAKGAQQNEAPPNIVTDHAGFRGQAAIRFPGGCVACHSTGINKPSDSEFRDYIAAGVEIYATPKEKQEAIDLFHSTKPGKQIERDNADFAAAIKAINGLDGESNADAFRGTLDGYDREVSLETAAAELNTTAAELRLAIAYASNGGAKLGARLAGLPHGKNMSRATWEQEWYSAYVAVQVWEKSQ